MVIVVLMVLGCRKESKEIEMTKKVKRLVHWVRRHSGLASASVIGDNSRASDLGYNGWFAYETN